MSDKDSHKNCISINHICSCIEFSGSNCVDFLNNLLISDLPSLSLNKFHYTALCNPKGRIISSLWIAINDNDNLKLICPTNMKDELINFFNMRKFRLKINIIPNDDQILLDTNGVVDTNVNNNNQIENDNNSKFYHIIIGVNFPWINKENSEMFIPQHVNLDQHEGIMSFTKGCYPGQEIIARMKFLGKIKKRMAVIKNDNQAELLTMFKSRNQVSPIITDNSGNHLVQVIKKLPG